MNTEVKLLQGDALYDELVKRLQSSAFPVLHEVLLNSLLPLIYKEEEDFKGKHPHYPFVSLTVENRAPRDRFFFDLAIAFTVANLLDLGVVPGIAYLSRSIQASELFVHKVKSFYDMIPDRRSERAAITPTTIRVSNSSYMSAYSKDTNKGMSETMVIALEPLDQEVLSGVLYPVMTMKDATVWVSKENTDKAFKELPDELWVEWKM